MLGARLDRRPGSLPPVPRRTDPVIYRTRPVRRWLNGRVPYPHNRAAIAELVGVAQAELWPDAGRLLAARVRPEGLGRSTRTSGPSRGRFGCSCSDRPSMRLRSWPTARCCPRFDVGQHVQRQPLPGHRAGQRHQRDEDLDQPLYPRAPDTAALPWPPPRTRRSAAPGRPSDSRRSRCRLAAAAVEKGDQEARTLAFWRSNSSAVMTPRSRSSASLLSWSAVFPEPAASWT